MTTQSTAEFSYRAEPYKAGKYLTVQVLKSEQLQRTVALPMLGVEELQTFVCFLNENSVDPVHLCDCFEDFVYEKLSVLEAVST